MRDVMFEEYSKVRIVSFSIDDAPTFARNIDKGYSFLDLEKSDSKNDYKFGLFFLFLA